MGDTAIGVMYRCDSPPEQLPAYARLVERLGYDELWVVEDCFFTGAVSAAAIAASVTETLKIGIGILPAAFRNPALAAMELTNLERVFPGRILPGFGHGMPDWVRQVGADHPSPLAVLGETVSAVRALLAGETVTVDGRYARLDGVKLAFPPAEAPLISTGVRGPKSLRLSGQVADGTILTECTSAPSVRWSRERIDEGRADAGRTDPHRLTLYAWLDFDEKREWARQAIAGRIIGGPKLPPGDDDLAEEIAALVAAHPKVEDLARALPASYLDRFTVAGTATQSAASAKRLIDAGADSIVFVPPDDPQFAVTQITLAAEELLPLLR
ncbi:alkanesulfonate monooxygenase SsuD/methylene tetrahydromethanopterin reductase-like flavin-dependent oxidoreductase (luciferase family) [Micromonospora pisi]|uniref:Alkanesulfonate monooxygenase SsuD/methylene tetrahydromethanopterin reductase-like flavin-dependent oxidoreductase (Luciferase family) n=1 Tax=Micromonospora pisi TaxID=589240 RepID=A0A495JP24_9ACTN|nr:LLM class flavin-dependent oxidoreductase [Micromonospora pisi]RKR90591.1 alkanesulfonate monooxygenase SsuD/methylene tetrahydromethanopterin reductase-like flavin-dependent oxidoreductase (luciferase family) [Micromonospora pisi]